MMTFDDIRAVEDRYQIDTYAKLPIAVESGEGMYVQTSGGKRLLDLYGGHAVALTGHCHPEVVRAIEAQSRKLLFYSNVVYSSVRAEAARALVETAPDPIGRVFFCNSGAEANETALKIARRFTGKTHIIAMEGGFHGRTAGALSATALGSYRKMFSPVLGGVSFVEFGSIDAVRAAVTENTAGVMLEPIQSMAGVNMAPDGYYRDLRSLCDEKGLVLVFDEIQTGLGRTGSWYFGDRIGVVPDIITLAKGAGGGVPVGAVLIRDRVADTISRGEQGSTFGGGPLAAAAVAANIEVIRKEGLVENAKRVGDYLRRKLPDARVVKNVKGCGLLIGIELAVDAKPVRDYLLGEKGIITGTSAKENVLRLLPPLIMREEHADIVTRALKEFPAP